MRGCGHSWRFGVVSTGKDAMSISRQCSCSATSRLTPQDGLRTRTKAGSSTELVVFYNSTRLRALTRGDMKRRNLLSNAPSIRCCADRPKVGRIPCVSMTSKLNGYGKLWREWPSFFGSSWIDLRREFTLTKDEINIWMLSLGLYAIQERNSF